MPSHLQDSVIVNLQLKILLVFMVCASSLDWLEGLTPTCSIKTTLESLQI